MCAALEPRRYNGLCGTCSELGHLSCHCLLQRDHIYSDVPTLSSPPQINRSGRGGTGYDLPISPRSYSGRSGGTGYGIPWSPPLYSGSNNGYGTNEGPEHQYGRGADGSAGYGAIFAQQQPAPRPFRSFGWDQRYACRNGPPVNGGLSHSIAQGQAQRDVGVDGQEEGQRPSTEVEHHGGPLSEMFGPPGSVEQQRAATEVDCHGGPVLEVSGPPEATVTLARGGLPLQARHQRRLQPPNGTLSPPTAIISDSAFEEWLQSDNTEMPMFSQSEGPQQSAPTAVALAAAAPAAEAVTGTRVFPAVSSKGVAEVPASSPGAVSAAAPTAAPAIGGTVFPTASVGGAARAPASANGTAALTAASATGGTIPFAVSVGGAPASPAVAAASAEISAVEPATRGTVPSAAPIRGAVGERESSAGVVSSDAAAEAAPSTGDTAAPVALAARAARALASAAESAGEICGERGASTHPFDPGSVCPLEVRYSSDEQAKYNSSDNSSSSSNDNTSDHDSWWDAICVGALLRPFDLGKRCRRSARRGKAVLGVDLSFDRGKAWGRMQHGG